MAKSLDDLSEEQKQEFQRQLAATGVSAEPAGGAEGGTEVPHTGPVPHIKHLKQQGGAPVESLGDRDVSYPSAPPEDSKL